MQTMESNPKRHIHSVNDRNKIDIVYAFGHLLHQITAKHNPGKSAQFTFYGLDDQKHILRELYVISAQCDQ
jgi:hypothetical protein